MFLKGVWPQIKPIFIKQDSTSQQAYKFILPIATAVFMILLIMIYTILEIVFLKIEYLSAWAIHSVMYI